MNQIPKVLVCAPTNAVKEYCGSRYRKFLRELTYPNMEVFLCDNSMNNAYVSKIKGHGFDCGHIDPHGKSNQVYMAQSMERCRYEAMVRNCDFMFVLETDIFPPCEDIIERLMIANVRVVSGMYHIMTGRDSHLCISTHLPVSNARHIDTVLLKNGMDTGFVDGNVKRVFQSGLGCTLIKRNVFSKIKFRVTKEDFHADTWFYVDLANMGIPAYVDTKIICEHLNQSWIGRK